MVKPLTREDCIAALKLCGNQKSAAEQLGISRFAFRRMMDGINKSDPLVKSHLIIPDSHVHPDYSNERFDWLRRFILDMQPTDIIDLGDGPDLPSLSSYDKGKKSFEGRRYRRDIEAYHDSQERLTRDWGDYSPRMWKLGGNHDQGRIDRIVQDHPEWDGFIGTDDLQHEHYGWSYVPFRDVLELDGIAYCHFFPSGIMGRPIGGENQAASMIKKNFMSSVAGHSHTFDHSERTKPTGQKIFGLSAGCFLHPDYMKQPWCRGFSHMWWNGVVLLERVSEGYYRNMICLTHSELRKRHGNASGRAA